MKRTGYAFLKRTADLILAAFLSVIFLVPMGALMATVRLTSRGPALFRQIRLGRDRKPFTIYKLRTMDQSGEITPVGRWLRRYSLDELPQLWNVLRGEMSLVGYRPLIPEQTEPDRLRAECGVYGMRPGMTGLAQISGRDRLGDGEKVAFDRAYCETASVWTDLSILLRTVGAVLSAKDVKEGRSGGPDTTDRHTET